MKMKIIEEKDNPVLKRKEIILELQFTGATTSKAEMQLAVSKEKGVPPEKVEVCKVMSETGMPRGKAWVKIWEEKTVELYGKKEEKKEEPAAPKEPKKEEKPAEKKEAPKEEKKE